MKHRSIGGLVLAVTFSLAACAPQGAGESPEASGEPQTMASAAPSVAAEASETPEPTETPEGSETPQPTPDDYEY